ncbi:hypothetical protein ACFL0X_01065 [Nanoarchaeota archaeon]
MIGTIKMSSKNQTDISELIKQLKLIAKEGSERATRLGIKESDVPEMIRKVRRGK